MSAVFPVNEDPRWRIHDASPGQTVFAIPYAFQDATDITVVKIAPDGARTELSQLADYTVTGAGNPSGGSYTLAVPAQAGEKYLNFGDAEMARTSSVVRMGKFSSVAIDEDLDRALIRDLELRRDVARALKMDIGEDGLTVERVAEGHFWLAGPGGRMVDGGSAEDISQAQGYAAEAGGARDEAQEARDDAQAAQSAAENAQSAAEAAQQGAEDARDFAYAWSSAAEDAPVNDGIRAGFSAFHWAAKAAALVTGGNAAAIHGADAKPSPADADELALVDSADGWSLKKLTWANIKAALSSVFLPKSGGVMTGLLTLAPSDDDPDGTASLNIPAGADTPDVQVDGDLWADSNEDLRYRRGGTDATVYDSVNLPRPEAGEMAAGTETAPRALSAADVRGGVAALALGVGQTWQNMTSSRSAATAYQNTTGKPIMVAIHGGTSFLQVSTDGSTWVNLLGGPNNWSTRSAIIPHLTYYRWNNSNSDFNLWMELR